ncbi:class I SAM-dependent methyltransferase [Methanoculleus horonobensis]|uniref:class I SAM-dependent methyltransferase n=1 Tax=Methanoculleus horonobensis TaxID=528314 RepID=UPI00082CB61A|nr:class I SAM-dependent methyltransferase family protein [Methanoculleus horonobensis]MDD4252498.1 class I SAM-dependent methyltransferase family protein [Methanoculleus horonobensis]
MGEEQWCLAVPRREAEGTRRRLLEEGLLDRRFRPRPEGDAILFPVTEEVPGAVRCEFEAVPERLDLPRHELVGGIAIMQENDSGGAERLLASRPSLETVLFPETAVEGEYRTRRFSVLAGVPTTRTRVTEYGHSFDVDLSLAYFSARLSTERQRILGAMGEGEQVLDMFAGVGPFAITLAGKAGIVVAADLNPAAVHLLIENIALNRAGNVIPMLADAAHLPRLGLPPFDRVVMNLPLAAPEFLPAAAALCRDGGTIHLYALEEQEGEYLPLIREVTNGEVVERQVRTYSPGKWHAVYDIAVEKGE